MRLIANHAGINIILRIFKSVGTIADLAPSRFNISAKSTSAHTRTQMSNYYANSIVHHETTKRYYVTIHKLCRGYTRVGCSTLELLPIAKRPRITKYTHLVIRGRLAITRTQFIEKNILVSDLGSIDYRNRIDNSIRGCAIIATST